MAMVGSEIGMTPTHKSAIPPPPAFVCLNDF